MTSSTGFTAAFEHGVQRPAGLKGGDVPQRRSIAAQLKSQPSTASANGESSKALGGRAMSRNLRSSRASTTSHQSQVDAVEINTNVLTISRCKGVDPTTWIGKIVFTSQFDSFAGFVVLFNYVVMTMETQATATDDSRVTEIVTQLNRVLLVFYAFECGARLYELGCPYFKGSWNNLDFFIVICGLFSEAIDLLKFSDVGALGDISMLKSLRMIRLLRLLRLLVAFRELYTLLAGLGRCMKTLVWSAGLIFSALNVWAILSVEFLQPLVEELTAKGVYSKCEWCQTAFENIWLANITWFQFVAGEAWNDLMRPLIIHYYWPFAMIATSVFIIVWGFLNLIVAAIVDSAAQARDEDIVALAKLAEQEQADTFKLFHDLCVDMDKDNSGEISLQEFQEVWQYNRELRAMCAVMGVEIEELVELFGLMDTDQSGNLGTDEFIDGFYEMRTHNMKTTMFIVLKHAQAMYKKQKEHTDLVRDLMETLTGVRPTSKNQHLKPVGSSKSTDSTYTIVKSMETASIAHGSSDGHGAKEAKTIISNGNATQSAQPTGDLFGRGTNSLPEGWYYFGPPSAISSGMLNKDSKPLAPKGTANESDLALSQTLDGLRRSIELLNHDHIGNDDTKRAGSAHSPSDNGPLLPRSVGDTSNISKPLAGLLPPKKITDENGLDVGVSSLRAPCCAGPSSPVPAGEPAPLSPSCFPQCVQSSCLSSKPDRRYLSSAGGVRVSDANNINPTIKSSTPAPLAAVADERSADLVIY